MLQRLGPNTQSWRNIAMATKILYAITSHGFGHATRAVEIARRLKQAFPAIEITLSTGVNAGAVQNFCPQFSQYQYRQQHYEPGLIQKNCFEADISATRQQYRQLYQQLPTRVQLETDYLADAGIDAVISDVAAIPLAAAERLKLPSLVIGNFTWDWVLQPLVAGCDQLSHYRRILQRQYSYASLYLQLPFHADSHPFTKHKAAPLIGRRATTSRQQTLARLGIVDDPARPLVLVSIGGWDAQGLAAIDIQQCENFRFLIIGDLPINAAQAEIIRLPFSLANSVSFPDLVHIAAAGVVKPGYGSCSEFVLNSTAMVGIERRHNREAAILEDSVSRYIPFASLSLDNFFAGDWQAALECVCRQPLHEFAAQDNELRQMTRTIAAVLRI